MILTGHDFQAQLILGQLDLILITQQQQVCRNKLSSHYALLVFQVKNVMNEQWLQNILCTQYVANTGKYTKQKELKWT